MLSLLLCDKENFSNAVVEYMAAGLPVAVDDSVNGFVVPAEIEGQRGKQNNSRI